MTVVSALISQYCTVHASDSLLTTLQDDGIHEPIEWQAPKIVPVRHWRGAMSYWGLALYPRYHWSTLDWLTSQATSAGEYSCAEEFARSGSEQLQKALAGMSFTHPIQAGVGIHFTAYEYIDGYWIPELFLISNWADPSYSSLRASGVGCTRETFRTVAGTDTLPEHGEPSYRRAVHQWLHERGNMLSFNNGDPVLYNAAASALFGMFRELGRRGLLTSPEVVETCAALAQRPVEVVSEVQHDFCRPGTQLVGGRPHHLAITPNGEYFSKTDPR